MLMLAYSKNHLNDERYSFDIVAEVFSINVTDNIIVVKIPHGKYKTCCSNCLELRHLSSEFLWSLDGNLLGHLGKYKPRKPIICRACGLKSEWIVGTSRKAFVCKSCRSEF